MGDFEVAITGGIWVAAGDESSAVVSVQLDTLIKAARALGKVIEIKIKRAPKKEAA